MMSLIHRVLVLAVIVTALGALVAWSPRGNGDDPESTGPRTALASPETQFCPLPAEDRVVLVPVPEEQDQPTLAPPGPAEWDSRGEVVVVQVEGESAAPDEALSPIAPISDSQNEPTPAPPGPISGGASPRVIIVRVEAEQAAEEDLPADEGPRERPRVGG